MEIQKTAAAFCVKRPGSKMLPGRLFAVRRMNAVPAAGFAADELILICLCPRPDSPQAN